MRSEEKFRNENNSKKKISVHSDYMMEGIFRCREKSDAGYLTEVWGRRTEYTKKIQVALFNQKIILET